MMLTVWSALIIMKQGALIKTLVLVFGVIFLISAIILAIIFTVQHMHKLQSNSANDNAEIVKELTEQDLLLYKQQLQEDIDKNYLELINSPSYLINHIQYDSTIDKTIELPTDFHTDTKLDVIISNLLTQYYEAWRSSSLDLVVTEMNYFDTGIEITFTDNTNACTVCLTAFVDNNTPKGHVNLLTQTTQ